MKKNKRVVVLSLSVILLGLISWVIIQNTGNNTAVTIDAPTTTETNVQFVSSTVAAEGVVTAQNQAKLTFQTSGKLVRLPFQEGDKVSIGQIIAQLDTYALQRQLTGALNNYRATRDTFDQTQQNSQANVLNPQLTVGYSNATYTSTTAVDEAVKRIVDQNQASLDNSVINVELANYALQFSRLTSPLNGILLHEDVTVTGMNVTPATTFTVADPESMVFRANVLATNSYYISEGSTVSLALDGIQEKIQGTVAKIYPSKIVLPNGQSAFQVDIISDQLKKLAKLNQTGRATITTNSENVALVPAWTVIGGKYIWIENNGSPEIREVSVGKTHDNEIEVLQGLAPNDKIITNPRYIASLKYQLL